MKRRKFLKEWQEEQILQLFFQNFSATIFLSPWVSVDVLRFILLFSTRNKQS